MEKKNKKSHKTEIIITISLVLIVAVILAYPYFRPRTTMWCSFEENITNEVPHNNCIYMKIITQDTDELNLDAFFEKGVGAGCYDSYDELPDCDSEEFYFTQIDLSELRTREGDKIDGTICLAYHTTFYYSNNTLAESSKELYKMSTFQERFENKGGLLIKFENCEVN